MPRDARRTRRYPAAVVAGIAVLCALAAAPVSVGGAVPPPLVGCDQRVEGSKRVDHRPKGIIVVPDVIWVMTGVGDFIRGPGSHTADGRLVFKIPVAVNAGLPARTLRLSVVEPEALLNYAGTTGRVLRLRACAPGHPGFSTNPPVGEWTGWAGGIEVAERTCVHLVIREGKRTHRLRVGLGVRC